MSNKASYLDSIENLFKLHYKILCNVANNIVYDTQAAEDIVQDVFLKLWRKKDQLIINYSVKNYLYKATINTALSHLEKNKRTLPVEQGTILQSYGISDDVSEKLVHAELEEKIVQAINDLPPRCKTIFLLSRYEDMKYKQIARHLGISVKTVENQMGKALKKLRQDLKPYIPKEFLSPKFTQA